MKLKEVPHEHLLHHSRFRLMTSCKMIAPAGANRQGLCLCDPLTGEDPASA
jgi:hypothetical protein